MIRHDDIEPGTLGALIRSGRIRFGGNINAKDGPIYGTLECSAGKTLLKKNRVFFASVEEAKDAGFRPCWQCMRREYRAWKASKG